MDSYFWEKGRKEVDDEVNFTPDQILLISTTVSGLTHQGRYGFAGRVPGKRISLPIRVSQALPDSRPWKKMQILGAIGHDLMHFCAVGK